MSKTLTHTVGGTLSDARTFLDPNRFLLQSLELLFLIVGHDLPPAEEFVAELIRRRICKKPYHDVLSEYVLGVNPSEERIFTRVDLVTICILALVVHRDVHLVLSPHQQDATNEYVSALRLVLVHGCGCQTKDTTRILHGLYEWLKRTPLRKTNITNTSSPNTTPNTLMTVGSSIFMERKKHLQGSQYNRMVTLPLTTYMFRRGNINPSEFLGRLSQV